MKQNLHPEYAEVGAKCSCGNVLTINSFLKERISIGVCSRYHPFYTEKQKTNEAGGRVELFTTRFGSTVKTMEVSGS